MARNILKFVKDLVVIVVAALVISFVLKTFLVRTFYIPSKSMEQTLMVDDRVLVNQLVPDLIGLHRGDVVVFEDPGNWLGASDVSTSSGWSLEHMLAQVGLGADPNQQHLIKRVIGLPGDHVVCSSEDQPLTVNGVAIDETPYLAIGATSCTEGRLFDVTVPEGSIWVMGDNRQNSEDSSAHQDLPSGGSVPVSDVVGRAFLVSWPVAHWGTLSNHQEVFAAVPDPA